MITREERMEMALSQEFYEVNRQVMIRNVTTIKKDIEKIKINATPLFTLINDLEEFSDKLCKKYNVPYNDDSLSPFNVLETGYAKDKKEKLRRWDVSRGYIEAVDDISTYCWNSEHPKQSLNELFNGFNANSVLNRVIVDYSIALLDLIEFSIKKQREWTLLGEHFRGNNDRLEIPFLSKPNKLELMIYEPFEISAIVGYKRAMYMYNNKEVK